MSNTISKMIVAAAVAATVSILRWTPKVGQNVAVA